MGYVTLYRKWRPQTFEDVVGQEHIVRTLTNALTDNRVAHAYIFSGPRGTGKTSIAKILAKSLNCAEGPTPKPCNKCASCLEITAGTGLDVIEIDAASNRGIDEIRDIREKVKFMPTGGGTKVYIIDEVHMLTPEAFNALLKMLEEPPAHVVFILATTEPHKVLQTILSRCQRFDFRRLKTDELAGRLREIAKAEGIDIDTESIALIAKQARGGMRDAVSTLDQLSSYTGSLVKADDVMAMLGMVDTELLFRVTDYIRDRDAAEALKFIYEIVESGWDLRQFSKDLTEHFRNLFVIKNTTKPADAVNATEEELAKLKSQADGFAPAVLTEAIEMLSVLNSEMRFATDPRLLLELALIKMTTKTDHEDYKDNKDYEAPKPKAETKAVPESGRSVIARSVSDLPDRQAGEAISHKTNDSQLPTPSSRSAAEPVKASGSEIDMIKRAWPAVTDAVKKKKMSTFANLLESRPIAVENNAVVLEFNKNALTHKGIIESTANKSFIEGIVRDITGKPYVIKCVMGTNIVSSEQRAESSNPEPKSDTTSVPSPLEGLPAGRQGEDKGEGAARKVESVLAEVASSEPTAPPRNDGTTRHDGTTRPGASGKTISQMDDAETLNKLAGFFDAKVVETKERKDEA